MLNLKLSVPIILTLIVLGLASCSTMGKAKISKAKSEDELITKSKIDDFYMSSGESDHTLKKAQTAEIKKRKKLARKKRYAERKERQLRRQGNYPKEKQRKQRYSSRSSGNGQGQSQGNSSGGSRSNRPQGSKKDKPDENSDEGGSKKAGNNSGQQGSGGASSGSAGSQGGAAGGSASGSSARGRKGKSSKGDSSPSSKRAQSSKQKSKLTPKQKQMQLAMKKPRGFYPNITDKRGVPLSERELKDRGYKRVSKAKRRLVMKKGMSPKQQREVLKSQGLLEVYYVRPGDTMQIISFKLYRDYFKWRGLVRLNNIKNPANIEIGQAIYYKKNQKKNLDEYAESEYIIREGDTLKKLALKYYGTKDAWVTIYNGNRSRISNPEVLFKGTSINIFPRKARKEQLKLIKKLSKPSKKKYNLSDF